ncbi:hypothetical protein B0H66DRAFT_249684 [Apodospora peruviana]|uniref:Uncharacterized protein n=1 Tax=Apodospora peruviana TaxID=516989 RepID=A0AAE0I5I9_9PEZI|nr:hypothetical protein B0H66DRAFT_249684 [Apodospora peruviana]
MRLSPSLRDLLLLRHITVLRWTPSWKDGHDLWTGFSLTFMGTLSHEKSGCNICLFGAFVCCKFPFYTLVLGVSEEEFFLTRNWLRFTFFLGVVYIRSIFLSFFTSKNC